MPARVGGAMAKVATGDKSRAGMHKAIKRRPGWIQAGRCRAGYYVREEHDRKRGGNAISALSLVSHPRFHLLFFIPFVVDISFSSCPSSAPLGPRGFLRFTPPRKPSTS